MSRVDVAEPGHLPGPFRGPSRRAFSWEREGLWLSMAGVTVIEVLLAAALAVDAVSPTGWFAVHAAVMLALWKLQRLAAHGVVPRTSVMFLVTTAALGPVGALGSLLAMVLIRCWGTRAPRLDVWLPQATAEDDSAHWRGLSRRLSRHSAAVETHSVITTETATEATSRVAPFADVLSRGSIEQKQLVVALIANRFKPPFAPVLLAALNDAEPAVRVLAAAAAARIENEYLPVSMDLERRYARQRGDFATAWKLAAHYDEHANTGLLDETRALPARLRALELYRECAQLRPGNAEVLHARIRLLVRLGHDDEAEQAIAPLLAEGRVPVETLTWYIEGLFKRGRYAPLREACRLLKGKPDALALMTEACRDAVLLWSSDAVSSDAVPSDAASSKPAPEPGRPAEPAGTAI